MVPPDPRAVLPAPLDPALDAVRAALVPHRRRLWLRRIVRRAWIALAVARRRRGHPLDLARFVPLEAAPVIGGGHPGPRRRSGCSWRSSGPARRLGETALAVDVEGGLGDRVSSALELAVAFPASAGPPPEAADDDDADRHPIGDVAEAERFVRRQRRDALASAAGGPGPLPPRAGRARRPRDGRRRPRCSCPVLALPNPQDAVIAQQRDVREAADRQAERLEELAHDLETKGDEADDPRTPAGRGAARARPAAARATRATSTPTCASSAPSRTRSEPQLDPATEQRAVGHDLARPLPVAGGDRRPGREPRRRPGADASRTSSSSPRSSTR